MSARLCGAILVAVGLLFIGGACVEYYRHLGPHRAGESSMPWVLIICLEFVGTLLIVSGAVLLLEKR